MNKPSTHVSDKYVYSIKLWKLQLFKGHRQTWLFSEGSDQQGGLDNRSGSINRDCVNLRKEFREIEGLYMEMRS